MKALIICMLSLLFFSAAQKEKTDYEKYNLKGKVKTLYESIDLYKDSVHWYGGLHYVTERNFNEKGYLTKIVLHRDYSDTSTGPVIVFHYDEHDNETEEISYGTNSKVTYIYDDKDHLMKKTILMKVDSLHEYGNKSPGEFEIYKYDINGRQTEIDNLELDSTLNQRTLINYGINNIKTEKVFDNKGVLLFGEITKGNCIENVSYDPDGVIASKSICCSDRHGNFTVDSAFFREGLTKRIIVYDSNDNIIQIDMVYKQGNYKEENSQKYVYKFDSIGNWTRQTLFQNDTLNMIISRRLLYYK